MREPPRIPAWRWAVWWFVLLLADVVFYVLLTPLWLGIRAAAWLADRRARSAGRGTWRQQPRQGSDP